MNTPQNDIVEMQLHNDIRPMRYSVTVLLQMMEKCQEHYVTAMAKFNKELLPADFDVFIHTDCANKYEIAEKICQDVNLLEFTKAKINFLAADMLHFAASAMQSDNVLLCSRALYNYRELIRTKKILGI